MALGILDNFDIELFLAKYLKIYLSWGLDI